jgi:hypothetical protein
VRIERGMRRHWEITPGYIIPDTLDPDLTDATNSALSRLASRSLVDIHQSVIRLIDRHNHIALTKSLVLTLGECPNTPRGERQYEVHSTIRSD